MMVCKSLVLLAVAAGFVTTPDMASQVRLWRAGDGAPIADVGPEWGTRSPLSAVGASFLAFDVYVDHTHATN